MVLLVWISRVRCHKTVKRCSASRRTACGGQDTLAHLLSLFLLQTSHFLLGLLYVL